MPLAPPDVLGFLPTALLESFVWGVTVALRLPSRLIRFLLAGLVLSAPAFCPTHGLASTFFTGLSVVIACRLADLSRFSQRDRRVALALWLCCPVVRGLPHSGEARQQNRKKAGRVLLRAGITRLLWEPLGLLQLIIPPALDGFWLRSAFLMVYFVLHLTALSDLLTAGARLLGATTDDVFDWPLLARSPRDFWSRRWNRFISRFALKHLVLPTTGRLPPGAITLLVFLSSGLFHEYFAWGASGPATLPLSMLLFFSLQGLVVAVGQRIPTSLPRALSHGLTFLWMALTAPLFFRPLVPPLLAFGVEPRFLPWADARMDWLPFF